MHRLLIVAAFAIALTGCASVHRSGAMSNNFQDFRQLRWIYQSESTNTERRISPTDYETEEIRVVEFITVYQDCQTISLAGDQYLAFKQSPTLENVAGVDYASRYGTFTATETRTLLPDWAKVSVQSTSNGDGTSRVIMTLRRAGPWEADAYVDVEPGGS